jgi:hopene-associated glycosyltransferase HpnB
VLELGIACTVSAAAWLYLLLAHGAYWRTGQRLPHVGGEPASWPEVTVVVPARNEAAMLPVTLPVLLTQDYPGDFRVTLVDDGSSDGTAQVAENVAAGAGRGKRAAVPLTVIHGKPPEPGWAGKVWAMAQGLAAAPGDPDGYVLFTDADIAWAPGTLRRLAAAAAGDDRDLVSQMALLRAETAWERIVVPAFVYFFAQLYPFRRVNTPRSRTAAAAGGCMLVRRSALAGGLDGIRGALIDDVALGRAVKGGGGRCWLGLSTEVASVRPYPRLADLWHMIARSAYTQLRYSPALLAGTILGLLLLYAAPPAGAIAGVAALATRVTAGAALAAAAGLAGWLLMTVSYLPMLRFYRLSALRAPALPLVALLYAAMTADSARRYYAGKAVAWRGRAADHRLGFRSMRVPETRLWPPDSDAAPSRELIRRYVVADVFTGTPLEGNQLGVFPDGRGLDGALMQRTARELNFSETVFFLPPEDGGDVRLRIFTPASELPFAGHPVLGSAFVAGEILDSPAVILDTGVGQVPVELERDGNRITFGRMTQPVPSWEPYEKADALLRALGVERSGLPVEAYRNGPRHVYVELDSDTAVAKLTPDMTDLGRLEIGASCFARTDGGWKTRMFAPALGVPEDPATGSAAGPLAVHLARHGRITFGTEIEIHQGSAGHVGRVQVGGSAVIVARGEYRLA